MKECHWEITNSCNLRCIHCISESGECRPRELTTANCKRVVKKLKSLNCKEVMITGGEPFYRKDIWEILDFCKSQKLNISIITNGTLLDSDSISKLKHYTNHIGISLDGSNELINDKIRGEGSFDFIIKSIKNLKANDFRVGIYVTLQKKNYSDIGNIIKLCYKLKVDYIMVKDVKTIGRAKESLGIYKSVAKEPLNNKPEECTVGESIFLTSEGIMYPCTEVFQLNPKKNIGNILKLSKDAIINKLEKLKRIKKGKICPYSYHHEGKVSFLNFNKNINCPLA